MPSCHVSECQIVRWTDGGFGMVSHNYDGDMLTDEIAQVCLREHRMCSVENKN